MAMDIARLPATGPAAGSPRLRRVHLSVVAQPAVRVPMPTKEDLLVSIRSVAIAADRDAFATLFTYFAPRVKGYLVRSGSPAELAEELAQETMVMLWRKAASFDPDRAHLSTWVFTIARNLRIDHHRRHLDGAGHVNIDDVWDADQQPADAGAAPEDQVLALQRERGLRAALAELPPEQSQVLRLSFFEEQPHVRIAEELNIPLGTVKSRIRLAVATLRRLLDRYGS